MRTLVEIGESQVRALDALAQQQKQSRAALIRRAIDDFLVKRRNADERDAFGLWGDRKTDGLECQHEIRSEW